MITAALSVMREYARRIPIENLLLDLKNICKTSSKTLAISDSAAKSNRKVAETTLPLLGKASSTTSAQTFRNVREETDSAVRT